MGVVPSKRPTSAKSANAGVMLDAASGGAASEGDALPAMGAGGADAESSGGGGSVLTPEGKEWLTRYEAYRDACIQANRQLYLEFFPG